MEIMIYNGIYFIDGTPCNYTFIDGITTEGKNFPNRNTFKTLDDVMENMAEVAKNSGGNAVIKFKHSEKKSFWNQVFKISSPRIQASGIIVSMNPDDL